MGQHTPKRDRIDTVSKEYGYPHIHINQYSFKLSLFVVVNRYSEGKREIDR